MVLVTVGIGVVLQHLLDSAPLNVDFQVPVDSENSVKI